MALVHLRGLTDPYQPAESSRSSRTSRRRGAPRRWLRRLGETGKEAPLLLFATGLMLLAILFSLSRGGILTMLFIFFLLNLFLPINKTLKRITLSLIALFLTGYGLMLGMDTVIHRFNTLDASGNTRLTLYLASLQMLYDHWATGIGLGSYTLLSPVYLKGFAANIHFDHAHNEFLELTLELGLPAVMLLFGWLAWIMTKNGEKLLHWSSTQRQPPPASVLIGSAAFCALLGFLAHSLVDFNWRLPANLFFAVTMAALLSNVPAYKTAAVNKPR
nr:O-antigen ligase family protein [Desulfobulbus alkaliphilus]